MTLEELGSKLREVDEARRLAQAELEALTRHQEHVEQLEKDRESLIKSMAEIILVALEDLTPEECNKIYRMLRLEASPFEDGYEVSGAVCSSGLISPLWPREESGRLRYCTNCGARELRDSHLLGACKAWFLGVA
jgi:hypothetical protein